jgi:hypothetical protein
MQERRRWFRFGLKAIRWMASAHFNRQIATHPFGQFLPNDRVPPPDAARAALAAPGLRCRGMQPLQGNHIRPLCLVMLWQMQSQRRRSDGATSKSCRSFRLPTRSDCDADIRDRARQSSRTGHFTESGQFIAAVHQSRLLFTPPCISAFRHLLVQLCISAQLRLGSLQLHPS